MVEDVIKFAVSHGYETAEYRGEWREFKCYEPILEKGRFSKIGLPRLIFEGKDGSLRFSTAEEAFQFIDGSPSEE